MNKKVNRRDFLKSSTVLGTAAVSGSVASAMSSFVPEEKKVSSPDSYLPSDEIRELQVLENDWMKVTIFSNGQIKAIDKKNQQAWETFAVAIQDETVIRESMLWGRDGRAMGEQFPARFDGSMEYDVIVFRMFGRQQNYLGVFSCQFKLEEEWLSFELVEVDDSVPSLVFPPPFKSKTLVLPIDGGKLLKNDSNSIYDGIYQRRFLQFFNGLGMRFIAGLDGENGWICAYHPNTVDAGAMQINHHITPAWLRSMDKWKSHYQVHYSFTSNNYVGIAKRYREYAIKQGIFISLKEKIAANPEVVKLLGGRALQFMQYWGKGDENIQEDYWATDSQVDTYRKEYLNFTFKEVMEKIRLAEKKLKFSKGMVLLRGWMHGGYDSAHPDIWPIESKLGTEEELKQIMQSSKYLTVLHDNYQDFYSTAESFPRGVVHRKDGTLMSGGVWFGKQAYITNSRDGVKYAKRNVNQLLEIGPSGHFVDCVPNNPLHESYEPDNELSRLQDMQAKYDILKVFHDQTMVMGSEHFGDFCVPLLHWIEHSQARIEGETIPLWQLVFHDSVFACRYNTFDESKPYPSWLEDMLYGNFLRFWIPLEFGTDEEYKFSYLIGWGGGAYTEDDFKSTYHVDKWHQKIGLEEMTSHRFLTDDNKVEEAIYGDKYRIIVNFDENPRSVDGKKLKPFDYKLEG